MSVTIKHMTGPIEAQTVDDLALLMSACVEDGAAIGMVHPFGVPDARAFWQGNVLPEVERGDRALFVAHDNTGICGTVQLITSMPPNQPHRCEIAKMMVAPSARRRGIGRALMAAALDHARALGKRTVTLDTRSGDVAEPLYASVGFEVAGKIPDFALDPDGATLHATTYMYLKL
ncbi:GNAT family N-acetyltransferase [Celeribacter sp.]|uniref:GNAT family N-acetyltransferase n=1 Tax=Celeribacter sp. TaxID=1890673 RepID=UPI003A8E4DA1